MNVAEILGEVAPREPLRPSRAHRSDSSLASQGLTWSPATPITSLQVAARLVDIRQAHGTHGRAFALNPNRSASWKPRTKPSITSHNHLYSGASAARLAKLAGIPISEAHVALRRHVGIVFDICHQAVEYENISQSLQKLVNAGIPVFKLQEAAAVHIAECEPKERCDV